MSISSVSGFLGTANQVGSSTSTRQNTPTSPLQNDLEQIREKGFNAWAHEQQMEKLRQKIRDQILSDRKLSEDDLAAMPAVQRDSIEAEIQKLIEEKLLEALKTAIEEAAAKGKTQAILIDISV